MADERGEFEWAAPDQEMHAFINDLERPVGTYLYGRRLYDTMAVWETMEPAGQTPVVGGGTHWLPQGLRLPLRLLEERRFASGVVYLRYATGLPAATTPGSNI